MQAGRERASRGPDSWENWGGTNIGGEVSGRRLQRHNPHVTWWGAGEGPWPKVPSRRTSLLTGLCFHLYLLQPPPSAAARLTCENLSQGTLSPRGKGCSVATGPSEASPFSLPPCGPRLPAVPHISRPGLWAQAPTPQPPDILRTHSITPSKSLLTQHPLRDVLPDHPLNTAS